MNDGWNAPRKYAGSQTIDISSNVLSVVTDQVDHDTLENFASNEHFIETSIDHANIVGNDGIIHVDWSSSSVENIHADNYTDTDTTYVGEPTIDITGTAISVVSAQVDHDTLLNFDSDEHWTKVDLRDDNLIWSGTHQFDSTVSFNSTATFNSSVSFISSVTVEGNLTVNKIPTGTTATTSTLVVNPASATANADLIWAGVGNTYKFQVDEDGDITGNQLRLNGGSNQIVMGSKLTPLTLTTDSLMFVGATVTFPRYTSTLAGLGLANTWTGATNTYEGDIVLSGQASPHIKLDSDDSAVDWYIRTGQTGSWAGWLVFARAATGTPDVAISTAGALTLYESLSLPYDKKFNASNRGEYQYKPMKTGYGSRIGLYFEGTTPNRTAKMDFFDWTSGSEAVWMEFQAHETNGKSLSVGGSFVSADYDLGLVGQGVLCLKETTTPTADTNYGKVYCKNDDKLYFQDGAGNEHEVAFV